MSKVYYEQPKVKSECWWCGDTKVHTHKGKGKQKGKVFPTPFYYKAFRKTGWFRGDDEYLGRICKKCIKFYGD